MKEDELLWWQKNAIIFGFSIIGTLTSWIFRDYTSFIVFSGLSVGVLLITLIQYIIKRNKGEENDAEDL